MENLTKLNRRRWAVQLVLTTGLALLFIAALPWGLQGVTPAHADPGTLYVDGATGSDTTDCRNPAAPCATIGYALTQAGNGDTIRVAQGVYTESLAINISVTLRGGYESAGWTRSISQYETIIDGSGVVNQPVVTIQDGSDGTVLDGLTITGGSSQEAGGVDAGGSEVTIKNCLIRDNFADGSPHASAGGGVMSNGRLTIMDTLIINNEVNDGASGVRLGGGGTHLTMVNTLVANNRGAEGLHLNGAADLMNVTIAGNAAGTGRPGINHNPEFGESVLLVNSIIYDNGWGDAIHVPDPNLIQATYSDIEGGWTGVGNIDADPQFVDAANGDYHLLAWSPAIDAGTAEGAPDHDFEGDARPQNAGYDMGADEFVGTPILPALYVDGATGSDTTDCTNPAAPCATIGYALTQAGNGDEILVAAGTYTETLDVHGNPITLRGGYTISGTDWLPRTGETIVDANGADSSVFTISPQNQVTLEGFTVQGADHVSDVGGGFNINGATVVISDTVIRDNSSIGGAGVYVENSPGAENMMVSLINSTLVGNAGEGTAGLVLGGGDPIQLAIENTVFTGNTGNDILSLDNGPFVIIGGQVSENTVTGSDAIRISGSGSGTISGTEIVSNTSSAMRIWSSENVVSADNLIIRGNTGGGIVSSGILTLTNSLIEDNSGGGWFLITSVNEDAPGTERALLDGCTIRGNRDVPGIVGLSGHAQVRDTVIVGNDNVANNGDVINIWPDATQVNLVNVLLADNKSARPVVNGNAATGTISLMNVTAAGNNVSNFPVLAGEGIWTVVNTIVWGNTVPDDMLGFGTFSVSYSDIEGGWPGEGNIDADPRFVDAANGNYRLGVGSPCTDKGTPVGAPTHDIEGMPRDAAPDMGAYEWTGFRIFLPLTLRNFGP